MRSPFHVSFVFRHSSSPRQPLVPTGLSVGFVGAGVAAPSQGELVAAGAVAHAVLLVPAADALAAFDALVGVDEHFDVVAGDAAGEDVAAAGGFVAAGEV